MRNMSEKMKLFLSLAVLLLLAVPVMAQGQGEASAASGSVPITTVVTVLGPKYTAAPAVGKNEISVYESRDKRDVTGWIPAQGDKAALQLAILIDDASNTSLGSQLGDLSNFIKSMPPTTAVGVFYASNGTFRATSQWTNDHEAAAKALRLPLGNGGGVSSIFLSVMDLIRRWPVSNARREVLLIADGIDRFRGDPFSPDVQSTIDRAQTAGVMIHTLFATGVGREAHNSFRINDGQSNLARITDATGGESFFQGLQTPIAFAPFLDQLGVVLKNQYWLTWNTPRSTRGRGSLRGFRIRTERQDVEISNSQRVFVPGP